jgi:hypothetical protein
MCPETVYLVSEVRILHALIIYNTPSNNSFLSVFTIVIIIIIIIIIILLIMKKIKTPEEIKVQKCKTKRIVL